MQAPRAAWFPLILIALVAIVALAGCGGDDEREERPDSEGRLDAGGEFHLNPVALGAEFETLAAAEIERGGEGRVLIAAQLPERVPEGVSLRLTADGEELAQASRIEAAGGGLVLACLCEVDEGPKAIALEARASGDVSIGPRSLAVVDGVAPATEEELAEALPDGEEQTDEEPRAGEEQPSDEVPLIAQAFGTEHSPLDASPTPLLTAESERRGGGTIAVALLEGDGRTSPETIVTALRVGMDAPTLEREFTDEQTGERVDVFSAPGTPEIGERLVLDARIGGGGAGAVDGAAFVACACGLVE